ncbi:MAG: glycosyltransferase family 4 protein [Candidatus Rokubacteria bacterium]|nr:glycosyltransferase family 4 protein [Candidatus Rokubacteria bacterium]
MNVLFATEYFHPFVPGGTAWSLRILGAALVRAGVGVAVVTPNYGAAPRETIDGIDVFRFPFWRRLAPGPGLAPVRDHVRPAFHRAVRRAVRAAAREVGADVIHAQEKHSLVGAYLAARRLGVPVVLSLRDFGLVCPIATCLLARRDVPHDCSSAKLQRECAPAYLDAYITGSWRRRLRVRASLAALYLDARLKAAVVRRVDAVVGVSGNVLDVYRSAGRLRAGQGRVVYNPASAVPVAAPVDRAAALAEFGLSDRPVVLFVGKRSPGKGFPVLLDAAARVAREVPDAQFVVVGDGAVSAVASAADVRLLGARTHAEVERLFAIADVYVHPAVWPEPFSRAMLEAAASGTAIVATRTGGTPELLDDGATALLVPPRDAAALAEAIVTLLRDPALRDKLGARAREVVGERFEPGGVARELLDVYREVMRRAG